MPDNTQRLTLSSAPFVIQGQRVGRWTKIPYGHPRLSSIERNEFGSIRMMLVVRCWPFSKFVTDFFTLIVRKHSSPATHRILLCWEKAIGCNGKGKFCGCPTLSFSKHWSLLMLLMPFIFLLNDRFHWRGDWPAEWCSTRTKLVSYIYFPFISNKRQVKKGNCHTLISSRDHPLLGCDPS